MKNNENVIVDPIVNKSIDDNELIVNPVDDETLAQTDEVIPAPVEAPVEAPAEPVDNNIEIPAEPEPVVTDVVPEMGDESPAECACSDDPACCGSECCDKDMTVPCEISIGQYFGTLQESVTISWRYHLKTRKHHLHVTLQDFYYGAMNIVDKIIEQYQGICGIVEEPFSNCISGDDKTEGEYLTELKAFVENNRMVCSCGHSEIDSVIDEFLGLIDTTNYKITSFCEHAVKTFEEFCYEDYNVNEGCHCDDDETAEEEEE